MYQNTCLLNNFFKSSLEITHIKLLSTRRIQKMNYKSALASEVCVLKTVKGGGEEIKKSHWLWRSVVFDVYF